MQLTGRNVHLWLEPFQTFVQYGVTCAAIMTGPINDQRALQPPKDDVTVSVRTPVSGGTTTSRYLR